MIADAVEDRVLSQNDTQLAASSRPSFAVVIRTYQWDAFISRQVQRYREVSEGGDLFISVDETNGPVGPMHHDRILVTTDASLLAMGLANRFEKGSLIWWNNDYPQYAFYRQHPDYDFYVFVEYDSLVGQPLAPMIRAAAARGLDFAAAPIDAPLKNWFWWPYARQTYTEGELRATLNCVCLLSNRALRLLFARRLNMGGDRSVRWWPLSEAFVATEITRAGYAFAPLGEFGDDRAYDWFPPFLEEDVAQLEGAVFIHPVLDPPRYLASLLRYGGSWRDYFNRSSQLRQRLARLPHNAYAPLLARASWRRLKIMQQERIERRLLRAAFILKR